MVLHVEKFLFDRALRSLTLNSPILCYDAIQRSSCGLKILPQEVLAFRKFYHKEDLAVLTSNRKEVLAACRI